MSKTIGKNLLKVLSPGYRPHVLPMPKIWRQVEQDIDRDWIKKPAKAGGA
jgi:hypothetical protein